MANNQLPNGWRQLPLKRIAREVVQKEDAQPSGQAYIGLENIESWTGRLIGLDKQIEPTGAVASFRMGDVLFGKLRPYLAKSVVAPFDGVGTSELLVFRPDTDTEARFLNYLLLNPKFIDSVNASTYGAKMPRASSDIIGSLPVLVPNRHEQRRIADYLDGETRKIDGLIAEKEHLLNLFSERRQALITEAVTRGLDHTVPMKASGHPWLGFVPAHWLVERTRWLFKERDQRSVTGEEELLTVSHLTGVTPRSEKDVNMFLAESNEGYKVCHANDFVINTMWAWMGAMGVSWGHGICSPSYNVYEPDLSRIDPEFLDCLSRVPTFVQEVTRHSKGVWSSRLRLYPEGLYQIWLALPPLNEQKAIVDGIRSGLKSMAKVEAETTQSIQTLKALRKSIIESAVSGGIA